MNQNPQTSGAKTRSSEGAPVLTVSNLDVTITGTRVVDGAGFEVENGEVVALVGESGAGKSMTAMAVPQLLPPGAECGGSIRFGETELLDLSDRQMTRYRGSEIACVYQEPMTALNPLHTVGDFLDEAIGAHLTRENSARARKPAELLEAVGLEPDAGFLDRYPHQLSGGQRQRIMAAGAVAWHPKLLIADEPTTALDVTTQRQVLTMFQQLVENEGMGMVFVTHDMGVVADIADSVVVMKDGHVVEKGDVFSIFAAPEHAYTKQLLGAAQTLHGVQGSSETRHDESSTSETPQQTIPPDAGVSARESDMLVATNLTVQYGSARSRHRRSAGSEGAAVKSAHLEVGHGETLGIVGESGSGKTTVVRSILGLTPITSGSIRLAGTDIVRQSRRERRATLARIGVVFQDPTSSLDPSLPLWRIVTEPLWRGGSVRNKQELRSRAAQLLQNVGLNRDWTDRRAHELSGGQRQRVAIARAVSHSPDVVIADEPTSALDVTVQVTVLELLAQMQREHNFACVFISHDLYVVSSVSDRVLVMKDGRIVETGPTRKVLSTPDSDYTKRLISAIPIADPVQQRGRHAA